ncbi:MAG: hypothetical protein AB7K09_22695 [Planctomycetota bacterium]
MAHRTGFALCRIVFLAASIVVSGCGNGAGNSQPATAPGNDITGRADIAGAIDTYLAAPDAAALDRMLAALARANTTTAAEGRAVARLLASIDDNQVATIRPELLGEVIDLADVEGEALIVVRDTATGDLMRIASALFARIAATPADGAKDASSSATPADVLLDTIRVLSRMQTEAGVTLIVRAANAGIDPASYRWYRLFRAYEPDRQLGIRHPLASQLCTSLAAHLPGGAAAIALLDLANTLCRAGQLREHPFDSDAGHAALEKLLTDTTADDASFAHSAAGALAFIAVDARNRLYELAAKFPDRGVQAEAAWGIARAGDARGINALATMATDVHQSFTACEYLRELEHADAIPDAARDPAFAAMAEMSAWLQYPTEFDRAPDRISVFASRDLFWPPANNELRHVYLIRYDYDAHGNDKAESGVGMVGPTTFALFGQATVDRTPDDLLAMYCNWELGARNARPDAPTTARANDDAVAKGRRRLAEKNPSFR